MSATERSLALHRAVAERVRLDPAVLERARARVAVWLRDGTVHREWAEAWRQILDTGAQACALALVERSERMDDLRQVSPFAGVLDPRERWRILRQTSSEHEAR